MSGCTTLAVVEKEMARAQGRFIPVADRVKDDAGRRASRLQCHHSMVRPWPVGMPLRPAARATVVMHADMSWIDRSIAIKVDGASFS